MKQLHALTGLRGIAALVVFFAHVRLEKYFLFLEPGKELYHWHRSAVDLFFVLSGFTLAYVYVRAGENRINFRKYAVARFARIFPLYFVTLIFSTYFFVLHRIGPNYPMELFQQEFWAQLFMYNDWPIVGNGSFINFPAWSISIEVFCYLVVFPLLYLGLNRTRNKNALVVAVVSLAAMYLSFLMFREYYDVRLLKIGEASNVAWQSYWVAIVRGILGFSAGYLVYFCFAHKNALFRLCARYADFLVLGFVLILLSDVLDIGWVHYTVLLAPFVTLGLAGDKGFTARLLSTRLARHFGDISYSVYMWHIPVFWMLRRHDLIPRNSVLSGVILLAAVWLVAWLSYRFLETPARDFIKRVGKVHRNGWLARVPRSAWAGVIMLPVVASVVSILYVADQKEIKKYGLVENVYLQKGWHYREEWGVWSKSTEALIEIRNTDEMTRIRLPLVGYFDQYLSNVDADAVRLTVLVNGEQYRELVFAADSRDQDLIIDPADFETEKLKISFSIPSITSPRNLKISNDGRKLGIGLKKGVELAFAD